MTSAARLYRVQLALAVLALAAVGLALGVVVRALDFSLPVTGALLAACGSLLMPELGPAAFALLPLSALSLLTLTLGARSLLRQLRAKRSFLASLDPAPQPAAGDAPFTVFAASRPQAFCAGFLRPRIYLSTAAAELPADHVAAIVAHERHHARRRDPLRLLFARTLSDALFFVPALRRLSDRYAALAELAADEAAADEHDRRTLAAALLSFSQARSPSAVVGIAPERVDHLLGKPPRWELPLSLLVASGLAVGGLVGAASIAGALTSAAELNVPLVLAQSCMLVMLVLPLLVAVGALVLGRPDARRRAGGRAARHRPRS